MLKTIQREVNRTLKDYEAELEGKYGIDTSDFGMVLTANVFGAVARKVESREKELREKLRRENNARPNVAERDSHST